MGHISRSTVWRAGSYWEDIGGDAKVFLEKDGKRIEMSVEKLVGKGGPRFLFRGKMAEPPRQQPARGGDDETATEVVDESTTNDDPVTEVDSATEDPVQTLSEDGADEKETAHKMWVSEKVTSLEKENQDLKGALQDMERRLALQETASRQAEERCAKIETAIMQIAEFVQQQKATINSSTALMDSIVEEVNIHGANCQKVG